MDDLTLRQDVLEELEFEPSVDARNIGVAVKDGVVTLSGHVASYPQKLTVEHLVSRIRGVKGLAEDLEVRLPGHAATSDDEIAHRVVTSLHWSAVVPDGKVQAKVENGWVTLTGSLDWAYQRTGAAAAVHGIEGVVGVRNLIELKPRVSAGDVKKHIQDALNRSAQLEARAIRVDVVGNKVTLAGNVKAWFERRLAEQAAWSSPGVTAVEDKLTVS
jgi:osmotically-inducible protein OsmY